MRSNRLIPMLGFTGAVALFASCERESPIEEAGEEAGEAVEEAADKLEDATE